MAHCDCLIEGLSGTVLLHLTGMQPLATGRPAPRGAGQGVAFISLLFLGFDLLSAKAEDSHRSRQGKFEKQ